MKRLIKYIILFVFVCVGNVTWAEEGERESSLFPDSSYVLRGPKADFLEKYRKDAAFDYTTNIEDSPSIWDWIKRWILERLFRIKVNADDGYYFKNCIRSFCLGYRLPAREE